MEEYVCQSFTNLVPVNETTGYEQAAVPTLSSYSTASAGPATVSAASHLGMYDAAPGWVSVVYFGAFILAAGFNWYLTGNSF